MAAIQSLRFVPTSISGCTLWLDGADPSNMTFSGSNVTTWRDKSGNLNNAVTGTSAPSWNPADNSMNFNGVNQNLLFTNPAALAVNKAFFFFLVEKRVTPSPYILSGSSAGTNLNLLFNYDNPNTRVNFEFYGSGFTSILSFPAYSASTEPVRLWTGAYTGSSRSLLLNGGASSVTGAFTQNLTSWSNGGMGRVYAGQVNDAYSALKIYEVLFYNNLTLSQQQLAEGYLAWKWGLQTQLPTTHPYYAMAPNSQGLAIPPLIRTQMAPQSFGSASLPLAFFNPLTITGCQLWFDAGDATTVSLSGSNITQWNDKSGNGRNVSQATTANQGTYVTGLNGLKVVSLSAGKTYSGGTLTVNGLSNMFIFAVVNNNTSQAPTPPPDGLGYGFLTWAPTGAWGIVEMDALANSLGWRFGTGQANNQPFALFSPSVGSNYNLLMVSKVGTAEAAYQNGSLLSNYTAANTTIANTSNAFTIGSANATNNIGEILVFTTSLSAAQRQQIEGYLAWKWGLQGSLPVSHPFKTSIPGLTLNIPIFASGMQNGSFSPARISGNTLWLDSQDPYGTGVAPASNTKLGTWFDKSGAGRNATQTTSAQQPTYIGNGVSFVGTSSNFLNMSDAYNMLNASGRTYTTFVVEKRGSSNATQFFFAGSTANNAIFFGYNDNTTLLHTAAVTSDTLYTVAGWANPDPVRIWGGGYSGAVRNIVLNGTEVTFGTYTGGPIAGWSNAFIGYITLAAINTYYTGTIYEMLFYNSYLSLNQRQQVEGYLAWKWGLHGSLPVTHPFKRFPPPPN